MKVVMLNQKGGVGKTAITINLGYGLAQLGKNTLMVDCDPQGNLSKVYCPDFEDAPVAIHDVLLDKKFNVKKAIVSAQIHDEIIENLFIIPANQKLIPASEQIFLRSHREKLLDRQLAKIEKQYDYILIDCSPTFNVVSKNAMLTANVFIIPTDYGPDSLDGLANLLIEIKEIREEENFEFCVVRNMYQKSASISNRHIEGELDDAVKSKVLNSRIRRIEKINQARMCREPIQTHDPKGPGSEDFAIFINEFLERYEKTAHI